MKADAATIAKILGGKPEGGGYLCSCPVKGHGKGRGDLRPSLSVSDGKRALVFHCFAGCKPRDIIAALNALAPDPRPQSSLSKAERLKDPRRNRRPLPPSRRNSGRRRFPSPARPPRPIFAPAACRQLRRPPFASFPHIATTKRGAFHVSSQRCKRPHGRSSPFN